jgi:hypothetical protein
MRHADPFIVQVKQAVECSRAELELQKSRQHQIWVAASALHSKLQRTQLLLKQIDSALLRFNEAR